MESTLLTAKLYFSRARPALVPRPRLVERLQVGLRGPLTLVAAPAGSAPGLRRDLLLQLHSPEPRCSEALLTPLINALNEHPRDFLLPLHGALRPGTTIGG